jgi:hypothetical protein
MATQLSPYGLPQGDTTVLSRVNAIASDDGNLNKMAQVEALKGMNRRGLLNSTQSIGAAQDAVLRNALPIASQDAAQAYGASESGLDRQQQLEVQNRQNTWQGGQLQLDRQQQLTVQNRQNTFAAGQNQLDRALQQRIASWNLSSSDRNAASSLLSNMEAQYENSVNSILGNTGLSAADRNALLTSATTLRQKRLNLVEQLYNIKLKF